MVMASSKRATNGGSIRGTCEDCGNKAKRDCEHKRCRTCCKTRGFECPTHVRSTWIPVSRRRQLLHHRFSAAPASSSALPFHLITSPTSSSSGFQGRIQSFPAELTSLANFQCVRVTSDDNAVDQAAYQASVNIGGHLFTGILYDQGQYSTSPIAGNGGGESSSNDQLYLHHQVVGMNAAAAHPGGGVGGSSGGANLPYHQYPYYASNAQFILPSMQFFPHPKT
ncbi:hypothetical protein V2J09_002197 [Rumex salicifolius]